MSGSRSSDERKEAVLGRVTDPAALDREAGAVASLPVTAPSSWSGRRVRISLPRVLRCRTCAGGGCDRCGRSGAHRVPEGDGHRTLELTVPVFVKAAMVVRIPRPFGDSSPLEQLSVCFEEGDVDPRMELQGAELAPRTVAAMPPARGWAWAGLAAAVALAFALVRLLFAG